MRECYWCGRMATTHKRITLLGPAGRRVYECRGECLPCREPSGIPGELEEP